MSLTPLVCLAIKVIMPHFSQTITIELNQAFYVAPAYLE